MAYDNRGTNLPGIVAAADYSAAQHRFVAINSSGKAALCAAGARVDAVLDNNPAADQACSLMGPGSVSKVEASAAGAGALVSVWLPFHGVREANGTKLAGFVANADYTSSSPRFVTINSSGKAELTGAGLVADGVMTNAPDADEPANISGPGYRGDVESGGAVTAGDNVASDATGRAVTAAAGDYIVGRALEAATGAGEGLDCWIHMPGIVETP
jgi:hypothetical protein